MGQIDLRRLIEAWIAETPAIGEHYDCFTSHLGTEVIDSICGKNYLWVYIGNDRVECSYGWTNPPQPPIIFLAGDPEFFSKLSHFLMDDHSCMKK